MSSSPASEPSALPAPAPDSNSSNRYLILFGSVMLIGIMILAWIGRPPLAVTIGKPLPELDLQPLLDGTAPLDNAAMDDKLVVLHFWGTWCPPCKAEFPEFAKLASQFADNDQVIIASVSCSGGAEFDLQQLKSDTEAFMSNLPHSIPTYADPAAMSRQKIAWILPRGSLGYPTTLLVDRDRTIIHLIEGYYPGDMAKLETVLKSKL